MYQDKKNLDQFCSAMKGRQWQAHCFGASLTQGMSLQEGTGAFLPLYPYSAWLESFSDGKVFAAENHGVCGETTGEVLERFRSFMSTRTGRTTTTASGVRSSDEESSSPFGELCIFLCGTNDIGTGVPVAHIVANLRQMVSVALELRASAGKEGSEQRAAVLVTIPPLGVEAESQCFDLKQTRDAVNKGMFQIAEEFNTDDGGRKVFVFDLHSVIGQQFSIGAQSQPQRQCYALKKEYNADGIHFTKKGYETFAAELVQFLLKEVMLD